MDIPPNSWVSIVKFWMNVDDLFWSTDTFFGQLPYQKPLVSPEDFPRPLQASPGLSRSFSPQVMIPLSALRDSTPSSRTHGRSTCDQQISFHKRTSAALEFGDGKHIWKHVFWCCFSIISREISSIFKKGLQKIEFSPKNIMVMISPHWDDHNLDAPPWDKAKIILMWCHSCIQLHLSIAWLVHVGSIFKFHFEGHYPKLLKTCIWLYPKISQVCHVAAIHSN